MNEEYSLNGETIDKVSNKIYLIEDENERLKYIKNNTNGLKGIDIEEVKQIETDYYNNVYVLLKNGYLFENGELIEGEINNIYFLNGLNIYAFTNKNQIIPINRNKEEWTKLDYYLYNNNCSYKKIITDVLYIVALTKEGRVISTNSNPSGLGVIPENFLNVDDIKIVEIEEYLTMPFIVKIIKKHNYIFIKG